MASQLVHAKIEKRFSVTNLNVFADVSTRCFNRHQSRSKQTPIFTLPNYHCGPATRDFWLPILFESFLQGCHLDMQDLLPQQLLFPVMVQLQCLLTVDQVVVLLRKFCYNRSIIFFTQASRAPSVLSTAFICTVSLM